MFGPRPGGWIVRRQVKLAFRLLYGDDPDTTIATVRAFCDEHVHETVTAVEVAAHLASTGHTPRLLAGDEDSRRGLHRTVERYRAPV